MAILRYDPFQQIDELSRGLQRLAGTSPVRSDEAGGVHASDWAPMIDIKEEEQQFVLYADLPGVDAKNVDISMESGVLTIKGERRFENEEQTGSFTHVERARGTFLRRFTLPDTADDENITARAQNGVLAIVIPKRDKVQARKIAVQD